MNGSHLAAAGGTTAMIAGVLMWLSRSTHWPLPPLDDTTSTDLAGLIVMCFGAAIGIRNMRTASQSPTTPDPQQKETQ